MSRSNEVSRRTATGRKPSTGRKPTPTRPTTDSGTGGGVIPADVTITLNRTTLMSTSKWKGGFTTSPSPFLASGGSGIAAARAVASSVATMCCFHWKGFGAAYTGSSSIQECEGAAYHWEAIENLFNRARAIGTIDIGLTTALAMQWWYDACGATPVQTNTRPTDAHFQDVADLLTLCLQRNTDVKWLQVWNEPNGKGFWAQVPSWLNMYNLQYDAAHAVIPDIKVLGPYINISGRRANSSVMGSPVNGNAADATHGNHALLRNRDWGCAHAGEVQFFDDMASQAHGYDGVTLDGPDPKNLTDPNFSPTTHLPTAAEGLSRDWAAYIRTLPNWSSDKDIIVAEAYHAQGEPAVGNASTIDEQNRYRAAWACIIISRLRHGWTGGYVWYPEGQNNRDMGLWVRSDTAVNGRAAGTAYPAATPHQQALANFPPGTPVYGGTCNDPDVMFVASPTKVMVANWDSASKVCNINNQLFTLNPWGSQVFTV